MKNKKTEEVVVAKVEEVVVAKVEEVVVAKVEEVVVAKVEEVVVAKVEEDSPVLGIEQVASMYGSKMTPKFKSQHVKSILEYCRTTGYPTSGSEKEMLAILNKIGYKI